MSGMSTDGNVRIFAHLAITGVCSFHWPALYSTKETIAPIRHVGTDDEKKVGTKKNELFLYF